MAKKGKNKKAKRQTSGLMKILEGIVVVGSIAALLIKFFKNRKK